MKNRRGFTLIELLVVIGIMLVLMGVLLPVLTKTRRLANIKATQLDFQAIASALDAYKAAYGSYPRNSSLPGWNGTLPAAPPQFMSLAIALIGPGPLYSSTVNGQNQVGDGVTGFGSRVTCANNSTSLASAASKGGNSITVYAIGAIAASSVGPNTIFVSINDPNGSEDELGVASITGSPGNYVINFDLNAVNNVLQYSHVANIPVDIKIPAGIPQPLFLPADKFKILWNVKGENGINENGQPLLLDRWGGPIQYFTRFGPNSNRMVINGVANPYTPPTAPVLPITAGPLYGISAPWTINTSATPGMYSIYDQEDGTLTNNEALAFQWMLGDDNVNNVIDNGETLRYTGDYVLISAGPDTDPSTTSLPTNLPISRFVDFSTLTPSQYQLAFKNSGNVYNFER